MEEGCDCLLYSDEEVVLFTSLYEQVFAIDEVISSDLLVECGSFSLLRLTPPPWVSLRISPLEAKH